MANYFKKNLFFSDQKQAIPDHNINIWLDTFDDIFSDFDYRPYSGRAFSDDFMSEVRKVCKENDEMVNEVKLFIPDDQRNLNDEIIIVERLHTYFETNRNQYQYQYITLKRKGVLFTSVGILMMLIASYISTLKSDNFLLNIPLVIFEPAGWFLVWTGLDITFLSKKQNKKELDFYLKLSKSKIIFYSI